MLAVSEIKPEPTKYDINRAKVGAYSKETQHKSKDNSKSSKLICWKCEDINCSGYNKCKFHNKECRNCKKHGHSTRSRLRKAHKKENKKHERYSHKKKTNRAELISSESTESAESEGDVTSSSSEENVRPVYRKHKPKILTIKVDDEKLIQTCKSASIKGGKRCKPTRKTNGQKGDFHTSVTINESLIHVLIDTGADVNVISKEEATAIGITWNKSKIKLRPYGSKPLKVCGKYQGPIAFGNNAIQTELFIVKNHLETLISGDTAEALGIISFHAVNSLKIFKI